MATAAFAKRGDARATALRRESAKRNIKLPHMLARRRVAGAIRFEDERQRLIEVATTGYIDHADRFIPGSLATSLAEADVEIDPSREPRDPDSRPLWVTRDGKVLGVVSFERGSPTAALAIEALRARNAKARFVYVVERSTKSRAIRRRARRH